MIAIVFHAKNAMSKLATQDHSIKAQEVGAGRFFWVKEIVGEGNGLCFLPVSWICLMYLFTL